MEEPKKIQPEDPKDPTHFEMDNHGFKGDAHTYEPDEIKNGETVDHSELLDSDARYTMTAPNAKKTSIVRKRRMSNVTHQVMLKGLIFTNFSTSFIQKKNVEKVCPIIIGVISLCLMILDQGTDTKTSYDICNIQCKCLWSLVKEDEAGIKECNRLNIPLTKDGQCFREKCEKPGS
ncbi:unnamed protein product, partial [Meganyctiphanes norvegica]